MQITQTTPVLYVESIAPSLAFFTALGFAKTMEVSEVPDNPNTPLGFCALQQGTQEVMLQTHQSAINDAATMDPAHFKNAHSFLFMQTDDLNAVEQALAGHVVLMPRRTTFYGATEIGWREPGGHVVVVAQFAPA
jgi:uncharacterized glyoxalase superfamily protein PhnB